MATRRAVARRHRQHSYGLPRIETVSAIALLPAPPDTTKDARVKDGETLAHDKTGAVEPCSPPFRSPGLIMTGVSSPTGTGALGTEAFSLFSVSPSAGSTPLTAGATPASVDEVLSVQQSPGKTKDLAQAASRTGSAGTLAQYVDSEPTRTASGTAITAVASAAVPNQSTAGHDETTPPNTIRRSESLQDTPGQSVEARILAGGTEGRSSPSAASRTAAVSKAAGKSISPRTKAELHDDLSSVSTSSRTSRRKSRSKKDSRREKTKQDKSSRLQ
ncbi:hypothetical protein HPB50_018300 [Hyalomma asiaticum]|uniref:Uncharacterized protein n=1 Tax=Hyalomma asiaticum TaxID=266040 RepID=A0ACB7SIM5_HYAAI|nr:hypothetical protein HPB50_018300 [Hyalomma asiaticum]